MQFTESSIPKKTIPYGSKKKPYTKSIIENSLPSRASTIMGFHLDERNELKSKYHSYDGQKTHYSLHEFVM